MLYRDFVFSDLEPMLRKHDIGRTVLVQTLPNEADSHYMLDLADRHDVIGAVVGWTDLKALDAPARIASLAAHAKLRGLRPMLQDLDDDSWIADPAVAPAVGAMLDHGLSFDALVLPHQLAGLLTFARRFPSLPIVIDHAAKPRIALARRSPWYEDMARLAELPNVHCKLSGLVTEARPDWRPGDIQPYVADLLDLFGPGRLLWGSDWPVLNLVADYGRWLALCEALLAHLDEAQRADVFGLNACRFYRLPVGPGQHR
jgi:L-fuconolactonase